MFVRNEINQVNFFEFQAVCMFALVATSLAGDAKKEKRGLFGIEAGLPLNAGPATFAAGFPSYAGKKN